MWFMTGWDKVGDYGKKESGRSAKESRHPLPMLAPKLFRNTVVCKTAGVHLKAEMKGEVPIRNILQPPSDW